jgi:ribokinase
MRRVAVVGSVNADVLVRVERFPIAGETVLGGDAVIGLGGKGANQAVGLARLGVDVLFVGVTGDDAFGAMLRARLEDEGVDLSSCSMVPGPSGVALIEVDAGGENRIVVAPGANALLRPDAGAGIPDVGVVLGQLETPVACFVAATEAQPDAIAVLVPAPAGPLADALLRRLDVIVPNRTELAQLTGRDDVAAGAQALLDRGVGAVVVTLGADGALVLDRTGATAIAANAAEVVDTTGAGDAFAAGLCAALVRDTSLVDAARFGAAVAARTVAYVGATDGLPYWADVAGVLGH